MTRSAVYTLPGVYVLLPHTSFKSQTRISNSSDGSVTSRATIKLTLAVSLLKTSFLNVLLLDISSSMARAFSDKSGSLETAFFV